MSCRFSSKNFVQILTDPVRLKELIPARVKDKDSDGTVPRVRSDIGDCRWVAYRVPSCGEPFLTPSALARSLARPAFFKNLYSMLGIAIATAQRIRSSNRCKRHSA